MCNFFQGAPDTCRQARAACALPVLRKDFMVDPYQVYEARSWGADAILLIVAALDHGLMAELEACAMELGMDVLVEVHDGDELDAALKLEYPAARHQQPQPAHVRDLAANHARPAAAHPDGQAGGHRIRHPTADDVKRMRDADVHAFLVGEAFMRAPDPGVELSRLFA